MAKIKTNKVDSIRKQCQRIGDTLAEKFDDGLDVRVGMAAITSYKAALQAAKSQLIYKKITGNPDIIDFYEN
ncbi:MAG: hypothetical protein ACRC5G_03350 [Cetobacterium sp.]